LLTQLWYPPHQWQPGEIVITETMPWPLGDRWSVAVGVLTGSDWNDWSQRMSVQAADASGVMRLMEARTWARLASFERRGRNLAEIVPEQNLTPTYPLQANLAGKMALRGYDLPSKIKVGEDLTVILYWSALAPMDLDYTIFMHLLGPDGQVVAQHDDQPWWGMPLPTSTWQPGEALQDKHTLGHLSSARWRLLLANA
jgi:hypothetical protein